VQGRLFVAQKKIKSNAKPKKWSKRKETTINQQGMSTKYMKETRNIVDVVCKTIEK